MLAGILCLVPVAAFAESPAAEPAEPAEPAASAEPAVEASYFDFLNLTHEYWSGKVSDYAGRMDRFFGDDRNFEEINQSILQLSLAQSLKENGDHETIFAGRARLSLPSAKKRLHLLIETDPEEAATGEAGTEGVVLPRDITSRDSYAAAVRFQKDREQRWHFSADVGVRLRSGLDPYTRMRGSGEVMIDHWRFKLAETLFWFRTLGPGETTRLDIERASIDGSRLFRSSSQATWLRDEDGFTMRQDLTLYHTLNDRQALLYQLSVLGTTDPNTHAEEYIALLRYRHRLHRDWLFGEISPQMHYPVELDYHPDPQLVLRLEMLFGFGTGR
jgi:hypothetical protein